jgi:phosphatidylglycerol:prolipoprotein diacylglycerol transferase
MFPSISFLGKTIGMYPIMALLGIFAAGIYSCYITKKDGHDDNDAIIFLLIVSIGVLLGGHLLYGIVNYRYILYTLKNIREITGFTLLLERLQLIFGGSVFYGGLFGGLITAGLYLAKYKEKNYLADIVTPAIPLFHFFGRIGCFLGGCCFGIESSVGFRYSRAIIPDANGVTRFPVQLAEAFINIIIFFILTKNRNHVFFRGKLIFFYLLFYGVCRFLLEFIRGDGYRGFWLFFSTSQWLSIFCIGIALTGIFTVKNNKPLNPGESTPV